VFGIRFVSWLCTRPSEICEVLEVVPEGVTVNHDWLEDAVNGKPAVELETVRFWFGGVVAPIW
jgi:hypothetical protein